MEKEDIKPGWEIGVSSKFDGWIDTYLVKTVNKDSYSADLMGSFNPCVDKPSDLVDTHKLREVPKADVCWCCSPEGLEHYFD